MPGLRGGAVSVCPFVAHMVAHRVCCTPDKSTGEIKREVVEFGPNLSWARGFRQAGVRQAKRCPFYTTCVKRESAASPLACRQSAHDC